MLFKSGGKLPVTEFPACRHLREFSLHAIEYAAKIASKSGDITSQTH